MLSAKDLAYVQSVVIAAMDLTLTIERPTNATGSWLNKNESFTTIATGVKCLLDDPSEALMGPKPGPIGAQLQWEVLTPEGVDVQENDRVTISNGQVLRVQSVHAPRSEYFALTNFLATAVR